MYVTRAVYAIIVPDLSSSDPVDNQGLIEKLWSTYVVKEYVWNLRIILQPKFVFHKEAIGFMNPQIQ